MDRGAKNKPNQTQFDALRFPLYNIEFVMYNAACLILK